MNRESDKRGCDKPFFRLFVYYVTRRLAIRLLSVSVFFRHEKILEPGKVHFLSLFYHPATFLIRIPVEKDRV